MRRFSILEVAGKLTRRLASSGLLAGALLAGAPLAGCGADEAEQARAQAAGTQDPGDCGANGGTAGCFACEDLLAQPCLCKVGGQVVACTGEPLAACKAENERQYQACERAAGCDRDVLQPMLARCPATDAPDFKACATLAYEAYEACLGGGTRNPGGGTGR
jgi:hypothetical protein